MAEIHWLGGTMAPIKSEDVREYYTGRLARHEGDRVAASVRSRRLSNGRGLVFLAALGGFIAYDVLEGVAAGAALAGIMACVLAFLAQVVLHRRARRTERWSETMAGLARTGVYRLDRAWPELEESIPVRERAPLFDESAPPFVDDLALDGKASAARLFGPLTTQQGRDQLRDWLLTPAPPEVVRARQAAVRELAVDPEFRAEFAAHGRLAGSDPFGDLDEFLAWAEGDAVLAGRTKLRWAAWVLPPLLLLTVCLDVVFGFGPWWLLVALPQLGVARATSRSLGASFQAAETGAGTARALVPQLALLADRNFEAGTLGELKERIGRRAGSGAAHERLHRLVGLLDTLESRRNMVYAVLSPVLLLDVRLGTALDRWRAAHGRQIRDWVQAVGSWEALAALATVAHDHPDWAFPEPIEDGTAEFRAGALGHPLLRADQCVANDVTVGPAGTFLLVTGSNMSGKSTLLRAIGLNAVLAGAGAPVCAESLVLPPLRVYTSMRIDDSLADGVSLFMAELLRIRDVVEAARASGAEGRPVLYLLDEMLHGTNTAERRIAARGVVRHLLGAGAIGALSTHDLALAEAPDLAAAAAAVHFREDVHEAEGPNGRPRLTFDYRLRPGLATTRNALKLLEVVGLGEVGEAGTLTADFVSRDVP